MCKKVALIISPALFFVAFGSCFAKAGLGRVSFELPASGAVEKNGTDRPIDEEGVARIKVRLSSPQKGLVSLRKGLSARITQLLPAAHQGPEWTTFSSLVRLRLNLERLKKKSP
jgi:hypothetical protein